MKFVYPQSMLTPCLPDEIYQEEADAVLHAGFSVSLIDSEMLLSGSTKIKPLIEPGANVIYRGWMMTPAEYANFVLSVAASGGQPFTTTETYLATHYLPNWYEVIADLTPETVVLSLDSDWTTKLTKLEWSRFFVKDFVKSLKTSVGSMIERPEDIHLVAAEMEKYRGTIEGGLCIRRVENFLPETERRYFVLKGKPYGANATSAIPEIVYECANRVASQFFSIDVVERSDGKLRVVEIGDGQVSDLVGWSVTRFVEIWGAASLL